MCWDTRQPSCVSRFNSFLNELFWEPPMIIPPLEYNKNENECIECPICSTYKINIVLDCGHPFCSKCVSLKTEYCPTCRQDVMKIHKIYL